MKLHRRHIRGQVDVDSSPEGGRKAAPKHDVRRSFLRAIADLTSSVMQHVPPFQVFPALNSVPDEEPGEELHSWGSPVVPNEGSEWACGVPHGVQQPIKRRGVQLAVRVGERARPPVWYLRRTPPSHDTPFAWAAPGPGDPWHRPGLRSNNHKILAVKSVIHMFCQSREQTTTLYWPRLNSQSGSATPFESHWMKFIFRCIDLTDGRHILYCPVPKAHLHTKTTTHDVS